MVLRFYFGKFHSECFYITPLRLSGVEELDMSYKMFALTPKGDY